MNLYVENESETTSFGRLCAGSNIDSENSGGLGYMSAELSKGDIYNSMPTGF